jgi:hypothetical protein
MRSDQSASQEFARDGPSARCMADSVVLDLPGYRRRQIEANIRAIRDCYKMPAPSPVRSTSSWLAPSKNRS